MVLAAAVLPANPLQVSFNQPIDFKTVTPAHIHIKEATDQAIVNSKAALAAIYAVKKGKHTFENTILAYDELTDQLNPVAMGINILANLVPVRRCDLEGNHMQAAFGHLTGYGAGY